MYWSSSVCSSDLDHVLFGSANCTTAALSGAGGNAEACVYRRLTSGTAVDALGLDRWIDADRLELSNLAEREDVPEIPLKALEARRPGSFELDQGSVFWQPPNGEAGEGAIQLLNRAGEIGRASCRERVCQSCRSRWSP